MVAGTHSSLFRILASALVLAVPCAGATAASRGQENAGAAQAADAYAKLPLSFEPNRGQISGDAAFLAHGKGYALSLTRTGAMLALKASGNKAVRMDFEGANPEAQVAGDRQLPGVANYLTGNDPSKWHTHVPTYSAVRYTGIYAGTDLVFYGNRGELEYDFLLAPHADAAKIRLSFSGSDKLSIAGNGDLTIATDGNGIAFHKPVVYQQIGGRRQAVAGEFALLDAHTVGFKLGRYDHSQPLVIDPTLVYGTYIGGSGFPGDIGYGIAVDKNGSAYVTGDAESTDFPFTQGLTYGNPINPGSAHVFVSKFNAAGTALLWSTYIGGTYDDHARAIAVDSNLCAYVTGYSFSYDYPPTVGAFMTTNPSPQIGAPFVSKLTPAGDGLVYSTFLGGSGLDHLYGDVANAIVVDANLNAYVTGSAFSTDFPVTKGAYQTANHAKSSDIAGSNAFLTKLSWDGTGMVYSTYLGGSGVSLVGDEGAAVAFDASGNAYVAGYTYSNDFPVTASAFQKTNKGYAGKGYNAFVTKFNAAGTGLVYSTLLGGTGAAGNGDRVFGIAVDHSGDAFVVGETWSDNFPVTANSLQPQNNGGNNSSTNAFITKLNPAGSALLYSTYLGGSGLNENTGDYANGIGLDASGNAYVAGTSYSDDFPVTSNALQKANRAAQNNEANAFVAQINAAGNGLLFSTYLGGSGADINKGMTTDGVGNVYITGQSYSSNFPVTTSAFQKTNKAYIHGGTNAFVAKVSLGAATTSVATTTTMAASANPGSTGSAITFTATVNANTGTAVPTGSVVFSVDGVTKATVALAAHVAKYSTTALAVGTHTIKASYAGNSSFGASVAQLSEVVKLHAAATPKFTPAPTTYHAAVTVTLTDATKGAVIYYTINGATPTKTSTKYTAPFKVSKTTTVKAIAIVTGYANSVVATGVYTIKPPAPTPKFTPAAGTYAAAQTVKITDTATAGLVIYYTVNGTAPTTASTRYTIAGIKVTKTETIEAIAVATGYSQSAVAKAKYTIN